MNILFSILILVSSIALIISVMLQEGSEEGLGAIGGGASESLFGGNRGTTREDMLKRVTVISAVIFIISALVLAAK